METGPINPGVDLLTKQKLDNYVAENSENLIGPDFNISYHGLADEYSTIIPTLENSVSCITVQL